jgi:hypothetical protein
MTTATVNRTTVNHTTITAIDNGNGTNPSYWSVITISVRFVAVVPVNSNGKAIVAHYEVTNCDGTMVEPMICDDDDGLDHLIETAANESQAATPKPKKLRPKVNPTPTIQCEERRAELRKITG